MKHLLLTCIFLFSIQIYSQVGIGTTNPHPSSILDIESTSGGLLPPRLTETERDLISSPAEGLFIYNLDSHCYQYFNGTVWSNCLGEISRNKIDCSSIQVNGVYVAGTSLSVTHSITVDVLVNFIDTYTFTSNTVNGYSFSGSGVFSHVGVNTITLIGSGTPIAVQSDDFTISFDIENSCVVPTTATVISPSSISANCLEYYNDGNLTDGIYLVDPDGAGPIGAFDCYCDMTNDGGGWTLVFAHNTAGGYWLDDAQADSFNEGSPGINTQKYSILNKIDAIKSNTDYEFRLFYPSLGKRNHWTQTFDPRSGSSNTRPVFGYQPINIQMTGNYWGGLETSNASTFLDGAVNHSNWWYSIGSKGAYSGGVPAENTATNRVLLFVR